MESFAGFSERDNLALVIGSFSGLLGWQTSIKVKFSEFFSSLDGAR
jgi:hypothetical protein